MAVDMFLNCGDIKGESVSSGHVGEIDVVSFSWSVSQSATSTGGGDGKTTVQDLSVTKFVDLATPGLMLACCTGQHIPEVVLSVRSKAEVNPTEFLKITMTNCIISSVSPNGRGEEDRFTENVSINFAKVKTDYDTGPTAGGGQGAHSSMEFDIATSA
jgi:type VI secretion system secreted protein Hcp